MKHKCVNLIMVTIFICSLLISSNHGLTQDSGNIITRQHFMQDLIYKFTERPIVPRSEFVEEDARNSKFRTFFHPRRWRNKQVPSFDNIHSTAKSIPKFRQLPLFEINGEKYVGIPVPTDQPLSTSIQTSVLDGTTLSQGQTQIAAKDTFQTGTVFSGISLTPVPIPVTLGAPSFTFQPKPKVSYMPYYGAPISQPGIAQHIQPWVSHYSKLQNLIIPQLGQIPSNFVFPLAQPLVPKAPVENKPHWGPGILPWGFPTTNAYWPMPYTYVSPLPYIPGPPPIQVQVKPSQNEEMLSIESHKLQATNSLQIQPEQAGNIEPILNATPVSNALAGQIQQGMVTAVSGSGTLTQNIQESIKEVTQPVLKTIHSAITPNGLDDKSSISTLSSINQDFSTLSSLSSTLGSNVQGVVDTIKSSAVDAYNTVTPNVQGFIGTMEPSVADSYDTGVSKTQGIVDAIKSTAVNAYDAIATNVQGVMNSIGSTAADSYNSGLSNVQKVQYNTNTVESSVADSYNTKVPNTQRIVDAVKLSVADSYNNAGGGATNVNSGYSTANAYLSSEDALESSSTNNHGDSLALAIDSNVPSLAVSIGDRSVIAPGSAISYGDNSASNSQSSYDDTSAFNGIANSGGGLASVSASGSEGSFYSYSASSSSTSTQDFTSSSS